MSDCHLGAWSNHPELAEMPTKAFERVIDTCISEAIDFIIIAGDLFDSSLPAIDVLRNCTKKLRECSNAGIPVYITPGSHDFSPTGKTMISVLESAGLLKNVALSENDGERIKLVFTTDKKTGAKLAGMMGRKGSLEKSYFEMMNHSIGKELGFKIFVFHSAVSENEEAEIPGIPMALLPPGFDYYATGHVHERKVIDDKIFFPGVLFPTSFNELENYDCGFFVVEYDNGMKAEWRSVKLFGVEMLKISVDNKTPTQIQLEIMERLDSADVSGKVVLLRIEGFITGSVSELNFKSIESLLMERGAIALKKNTNKLFSKEYEEIKKEAGMPIEELEKNLIKEHAAKWQLHGFETATLTQDIMLTLMDEKNEDEPKLVYDERIKSNAKKVLGL
jgi:DNA repair exonuclease SbcCD nuclease subunit